MESVCQRFWPIRSGTYGRIARILEATEGRFVESLFPVARGAQLLKTGKELIDIEAALLAEPSVEACVVLERLTASSGLQRVAYVVTTKPFADTRLQAHMQARFPTAMLPDTYVPVSVIPLTETGEVDEAALLRLPVIDSQVVAGWETHLQALAEIEQAVVLVHEETEPLPPLYLPELLSDAREASTTLVVPHAEAGPQLTDADKLAIAHGVPLRQEDEAPATLADALRLAALHEPATGIVYIQSDGQEIVQSYPALLEEAERILTGLRQLGLQPQDTVLFQFDRNEDFIPAFWGCVLGGFVPVPLSVPPTYEPHHALVNQLRSACRLLERPLIFTSSRLALAIQVLSESWEGEKLQVAAIDEMHTYPCDRNWHVSQPDDMALILLTSGSTGTPKGVIQTHRSLLYRSAGAVQMNAFSRQDISLNWMPLSHVGGIVMFHLRDVYLKCRQIHVRTEDVLQNPLVWLDLIDLYRATVTWAPNFAFALINEHAVEIRGRHWDLSSMTFILNGGEAIVAKTARRFLELLLPHGLPSTAMHPAWGMSETCSGVTSSHRFTLDATADDDLCVAVGAPIPGVMIRIVDPQCRVMDEGAIGRVQVKGAPVTTGYYKHPELNEEVFTDSGWFETGDLGFLREGYLTITGREKEVIIINGLNYPSADIEAVVEEIKGVEVSYTAACAVRGAQSDTEQLAIFCHLASTDWHHCVEVTKQIRQRVVRQIGINPAYVIPVEKEAIPKTVIGKIQRTALRQRFEAGAFNDVLKHLDSQLEAVNRLPSWFYRPIWRRQNAVRHTDFTHRGTYLIFMDRIGLGDHVGKLLAKRHQACVRVETGTDFAQLSPHHYCMDPVNPSHYRRLLDDLATKQVRPDHILHLWTYSKSTGEISSLELLEQAQELGLYSLLCLIQALEQINQAESPVRLQVISSDVQYISSGEKVACEKAPLLGLLKTISQEISWLTCHHIDLSVDRNEINSAHLLQELCVLQKDQEVAYRDGYRWVPRLQNVDFHHEAPHDIPFKPGGMYLLSGGLGGIGVELARHLLQHYQARLLLVGRTPMPDMLIPDVDKALDESVVQHLQAYQELKRLGGEVMYRAVDLADKLRLQQAVSQAKSRWGCELDGVIHLAGIFQPRLIMEETRTSLAASLRAKMLGTWSLYQLIKDQPHGVFIAFSSVNGFFGGATASAYAAASCFLESFMACQQRHRYPQSYCFSWSMWDEVGMSRDYQMKSLSRAKGYHAITAEQGLSSFLLGLRYHQTHLLVGLDGGNPHIRRHCETLSPGMQTLRAYCTVKSNDVSISNLQDVEVLDRFQVPCPCDVLQLQEMPLTPDLNIDRHALSVLNAASPGGEADYVPPRTSTEETLVAIWCEVLKLDRIGIHDNFFALGGHSLIATQVISRIRRAFRVELSLPNLFESPTVASLAERIDALQRAQDMLPAGGLLEDEEEEEW